MEGLAGWTEKDRERKAKDNKTKQITVKCFGSESRVCDECIQGTH